MYALFIGVKLEELQAELESNQSQLVTKSADQETSGNDHNLIILKLQGDKLSMEQRLAQLEEDSRQTVQGLTEEKTSLARRLENQERDNKKTVEDLTEEKSSLEQRLEDLERESKKEIADIMTEKENLEESLVVLEKESKLSIQELTMQKSNLEQRLAQLECDVREPSPDVKNSRHTVCELEAHNLCLTGKKTS
jgi:chromosome segregation ATPase